MIRLSRRGCKKKRWGKEIGTLGGKQQTTRKEEKLPEEVLKE